MTEAVRIKRFYKDVAVAPQAGRYGVWLDGRMAKTRSGALLLAPTDALAAAIAEEWAAQGEHIVRRTMPLTGMQSAAIDGAATAADWLEEIVNYLGSDLVCYRAVAPQALAERQAEVWDPYLTFLRQEFGATLITTEGIAAVPQSAAAVSAVRAALKDEPPELLFALQIATAIAGSAVLSLALWRRAFDAEAIFKASRVDERFQEEQWGADEDAQAREAGLWSDFLTVARFLSLLGA